MGQMGRSVYPGKIMPYITHVTILNFAEICPLIKIDRRDWTTWSIVEFEIECTILSMFI